jgi:hypothetical protein
VIRTALLALYTVSLLAAKSTYEAGFKVVFALFALHAVIFAIALIRQDWPDED